MLFDSGADVSVVPRFAAQATNANIVSSTTAIEFYSGVGDMLDEAQLSIEFGTFRFDGLFLVSDAAYGILGRNVLNFLTLTLDGPALTWSLTAPGVS